MGFHPVLSLGIQRYVLFLSVGHLQESELPTLQFPGERFFLHIVHLALERHQRPIYKDTSWKHEVYELI